MTRHILIETATPAQLEAAKEAADWAVDAIATSTQNRAFLRGDPDEDVGATEAIFLNVQVAILRAMRKLK